jgi:excisionase family DNA binding protein
MASLSLREAAEQAGTSKSTIWRAIKSGRMSATRLDDGGFAIDPAELFRVFQPQQSEQRLTRQDAKPVALAAERPATDETALRLAALDAEVKGLRDLLAEVKANRDELRLDRDEWRGRAERLVTDQRRPWWRRLAG